MFGSRRKKYPSFSSSYKKKKKPVDPILTTVILLIGVYLAWSSYTPTSNTPAGSEMRASMDANKLLPANEIRSGIFSLAEWTPADEMQRTPRPMERNLTPHWYNQGIPSRLEVYFALKEPTDFFELLLAAKSGGSYGIRVNSKEFETFFDALDGSRKVLRKSEFPESQETYSVIVDTTDENLFLAAGGQLIDTKEIELKNIEKLGASTNLTIASVSDFNVENANGELEELEQ